MSSHKAASTWRRQSLEVCDVGETTREDHSYSRADMIEVRGYFRGGGKELARGISRGRKG